MILDHAGVAVSSFDRSRAFYEAALAPLGVGLVAEEPDFAMFGRNGEAQGGEGQFWIRGGEAATTPVVHLAFRAPSSAAVDAFFRAALAAGGRDNGPPGLRPRYRRDYYAAFVLDPDGHNVEAVWFEPSGP